MSDGAVDRLAEHWDTITYDLRSYMGSLLQEKLAEIAGVSSKAYAQGQRTTYDEVVFEPQRQTEE
ncbi:MAG: hypothetical protein HC828_16105 [Blastochloris sp.]|nr:hypothetical protein [Blastochloris sp.]